MTAAIDIALHKVAPAHVRINPIRHSPKGTSRRQRQWADSSMLLTSKEAILQAARNHDQSIVEIKNWHSL